MIEVKPLNKLFTISIAASEEEKLEFKFSQLNYFTRNKVAALTTEYKAGQIQVNSALAAFYNIKYALKEVKGLVDEKGKPYKLQFEDDKSCLTDNCVDELLATQLSDNLIYVGLQLGANIPNKIINPSTGLEIEGVEIVEEKSKVEKK